MFEEIIFFIRNMFGEPKKIVLHEPKFAGNEKRYVLDTIDSTFVSSVGEYVSRFEAQLATKLGVPAEHVVAVVNGTSALQVALRLAGVVPGDLVVTQSLTFVATCNAAKYLGADPAFVDVNEQTLSLSPESLSLFLKTKCERKNDGTYHKESGRRVRACVPMHTFGHPAQMEEINKICLEHQITVVEDAAEALGSQYKERAVGTLSELSIFSFNGNKIITTGGGGAIVARSLDVARRAKHLTTTAKVPHAWAFNHDELGYNFRMPNLNAALGCAQLEQLDEFLRLKRDLALSYSGFFEKLGGARFIAEPSDSKSNYWLNSILMKSKAERDEFLKFSHSQGVLCRPVWEPMHLLPLYADCPRVDLPLTQKLADQIVNLPSSAIEVRT